MNDFSVMPNWHLRIIKGILNDPDLELALLIQDAGSKQRAGKLSFRSRIAPFFSQFGMGRLLLKLQLFFETRVLFNEVPSASPTLALEALNGIASIKIRPMKQGQYDTFSTEDLQKVQAQNLDVIVKLGFGNLSGGILSAPNYGVWDFLHRDHLLPYAGPIGFWEVLTKAPAIGFTLLKLNHDKGQHLVLDTAFFNRDWSMTESRFMVVEGAVSVLFKNLKKLRGRGLDAVDAGVMMIPASKSPTIFSVIKYLFRFYSGLWDKIKTKILNRFFGVRPERWSLFVGKGNFLDAAPLSIEPVPLPKDEFWADPFIFQHKGIDYVFFEKYCYIKNRGKVSCGVIQGNNIVDVVDVLELDYHLSFPYIFEDEGEIFLMPETSENKRLEIYKAIDFPTQWQLHTTAFEGEMVADAFFYTDKQSQKWLFINKQAAPTAPMNSELFIYKTDSISLDNLQPHEQNPVMIDARIARNGGEIFEYDGQIYRPSQRNEDGIYGRALNINKIEKLTLEEYVEKTVQVFKPDFDNKLIAMHHLHQKYGFFVFDAAYKRKK